MTTTALLLTPDAELTHLQLPDHPEEQYELLEDTVTGFPRPAIYHRRAVLHVHDNGTGLPPNPAAWALASFWLGRPLPDPLHGPIVLTGPADDDTDTYTSLPADLIQQAEHAAAAAAEHRTTNPDTPFAVQLAAAVDARCMSTPRPTRASEDTPTP
ncbi:hypothetical protein ABZW18_26140 [Streptomyces sp. NPDC004647]|uniref:hypothetical protein n=1 Tax=Streptomyces sp. NPDC004647 TaxID=3154671 RepID=UPI0033B40ABD